MSFPVQFGLPQVVLILLSLAGLALVVTSLVGVRIAEREEAEIAEAASRIFRGGSRSRAASRARVGGGAGGAGTLTEDAPPPTRMQRLRVRARQVRIRPRLRMRRGASGLVLLVAGISLLWFTALVQTFLGLTGEVHAAHVTATRLQNMPHTLSVDLALYDDHGHQQSHRTYLVEGDRFVLQADIVELDHWVNVLGVHSGYKVTRLFGQYDDGSPPKQHQIFLNGGDESFFRSMQDRSWWSRPFVRSAYGNAVIASPGEYEVYVSQDAIKVRPPGH